MPYDLIIFNLNFAVCSTDNENYQFQVVDCNNTTQTQTQARNGDSVSWSFANFVFPIGSGCTCVGTLDVTGDLGPEVNIVNVTLVGSNISSDCVPGNGAYYSASSGFTAGPIRLNLNDAGCQTI